MRRALLPAAALLLTPCGAGAGIIGSALISDLATRADAIVVAGPTSTPGPTDRTTSLAVARTLKGAVPPVIDVSWATGAEASERAFPYGLWLLRRDEAGWTPLVIVGSDVTIEEGAIPLPPGEVDSAFAYREDDPTIDKVISELRSAVRHSTGEALEAVVTAASQLREPGPGGVLGHPARPDVRHLEACAARRLAREWDEEVVGLATQANDQLGPERVPRALSFAVCGVRDPRLVPALGAFGTGSSALHDCALQALSNIPDESAVPFLASFLESGSPQQQYGAIRGLVGCASHVPAQGEPGAREGPLSTEATRAHSPSYPAFLADRRRYVTFWRRWARCPECRFDPRAEGPR